MTADVPHLDRLSALAETIAGAWSARARSSTSTGQERAFLRLFGVHGIDGAGRPLAAEVVDRYIGRDAERLAGGIALPFAMALAEYDVGPQQLALDVASGAVDLTLEAELLREPDRRAVAEAEAARLAGAALARFDANRTARHELLDVLGDASRPWIGTTLVEPTATRAVSEALARVGDGVDLIRVEVPVGRELADRLTTAGVELPIWPSAESLTDVDDEPRRDDGPAPPGSQRGVAQLRRVLDEVAADRRGYVRLATAAPSLAAPEQAVVAGFERVDVVEIDAMAEIVSGSVDPDRSLADHAFAHRLLERTGAQLLVGAGPLVVAPDLARGIPSDPATRAGRALGLQLVGIALARDDGLPASHILVGALPTWLTDEPLAAARAAAEVTIRRRLLADHPLAFEEPTTTPERAAAWPFVLAGVVPAAPHAALVLRRPGEERMRPAVLSARAAAAVGTELAQARDDGRLTGDAAAHAEAVVRAAVRTLEELDGDGWRAVLGDAPGGGERLRLGSDAVVERSEAFDPLATSPARTP